MGDEKWIQELAGQIRQGEEAKKLKDEKYFEAQKFKSVHGPVLWEELKRWLAESCDRLNTEMGREVVKCSVVGAGAVSVKGLGDGMHTTMTAKFEPSTSTLEYSSQSGDPSGKFDVVMGSDGKACVAASRSSYGRPVSDLGKEILSHAIRVFSY